MEMVPMMYASHPRCSVTNAFMPQLNSFRHSFSHWLSPQNLSAAARTNCTGEVSDGGRVSLLGEWTTREVMCDAHRIHRSLVDVKDDSQLGPGVERGPDAMGVLYKTERS